jgi:hypothetical protein
MWLLLFLACHGGDGGKESTPVTGYEDGVYHCCEQGADTGTCCEGYDAGMCFEYGGVYHDCVSPGEELEGKVICAFCCDGGEAREPMVETTETYDGYPKGCGPGDQPPSLLVCVVCGDGVCGEGENRCVCPEDCG